MAAAENLNPNFEQEAEGDEENPKVKSLIKVFEKMKVANNIIVPNAKLGLVVNRRVSGKANVSPKTGQENQYKSYVVKGSRIPSPKDTVNGRCNGGVRRWSMDRPLAERQPNNLLGGGFQQSNVKNAKCGDDHSDTQSSQGSSQSTSTRTESSFGRERKCKKSSTFPEKGSPIWRNWTKVHPQKEVKVTSAQPFNLKTEQRGRKKEQDFRRKVQKMMDEEETNRIPMAHGLPWTTDEPQVLQKPPVKEQTKPIEVKLHSKARAIQRAEFDYSMEQKLQFLKCKKLVEERLRKFEEEEETKRMRKEMVPQAQLMPLFDRPFMPKRSTKCPTIPREPKFHSAHTKCLIDNGLHSCKHY